MSNHHCGQHAKHIILETERSKDIVVSGAGLPGGRHGGRLSLGVPAAPARRAASARRIVGVVFFSGSPGDRMVGSPPAVARRGRRAADTGDA